METAHDESKAAGAGDAEASAPAPALAPAAAPTGRYQQVFNRLYDKLRDEVLEGDFTAADASEVGTRAMQALAAYPDIPGSTKREIVIRLVNKLVDDIPMDEGLRAGLKLATSTLIPWLIETFYKAVMKRFDLNGDGAISAKECGEVCDCFGKKPAAPTT